MSEQQTPGTPELIRGLWEGREIPPRPAAPAGIPAADNGELVQDGIIDELVWAFLVWEAGEHRAAARFDAFVSHFVDLNELRVCLPDEIVAALGSSYPRSRERAERLVATLADIYTRQHAVSLAHLRQLGKREARAYLDSLEGIPAYAAARVALIALGCHAFPLDDRLTALLRSRGIIPETESDRAAPVWLERQVRAGDAAELFLGLELWSIDQKPKPAARGQSRPKKKSAKKPAAAKRTPRSGRSSSKNDS
ncbi:MAG: hypothetical protein ACTS22_01450 [Phycisphaerales bacterium]